MDTEKEIATLQKEVREHMRLGQYKEARGAASACSIQVLNHFGETHPVHASCLNNLAFIHKTLGEYDDAIDIYEKALHVYKEAIGEDHASYATTLNNLGLVYRTRAQTDEQLSSLERLSCYEQSRHCFEHSLEIRTRVLTADHPDISMSKCNLGTLYFHSGKPDKAREMLEQVVEELINKVGEKNALTATAINNLAFVLKGIEAYPEAIELYLKVKTIREQVLGKKHVDTITVCHNLSEAYLAAGQEDQAQQLKQYILTLM